MELKVIVCFICILLPTTAYCVDKSYYADLDGDGSREKILINDSYDSQRGATIDVKIFKNNQLVFKYNDFPENLPFVSVKIVKFDGTTENNSRDIAFIVVGECDVVAHVICYYRKSSNDGGRGRDFYSIKRNVIPLVSCY